jgi:hypothetical protein
MGYACLLCSVAVQICAPHLCYFSQSQPLPNSSMFNVRAFPALAKMKQQLLPSKRTRFGARSTATRMENHMSVILGSCKCNGYAHSAANTYVCLSFPYQK